MFAENTLSSALAAIESGLLEEACAIARDRVTRDTLDVDFHLGCAPY